MTEKEIFLEDCYRKYYSSILKLCRREVNNNLLYADIIDTCIQDTFLLAYHSYSQIGDCANMPESVNSIYKTPTKTAGA